MKTRLRLALLAALSSAACTATTPPPDQSCQPLGFEESYAKDQDPCVLELVRACSEIELTIIDDASPFRDGKPYLRSLEAAGLLAQLEGIEVIQRHDYGRPERGGAQVNQPLALHARKLDALVSWSASLPDDWKLRPSHELGFQRELLPTGPTFGRSYWRSQVLLTEGRIKGQDIESGRLTRLEHNGLPGLELTLSPVGEETLRELSANNVGRKLAIVRGTQVLSSPVINESISGGKVWFALKPESVCSE